MTRVIIQPCHRRFLLAAIVLIIAAPGSAQDAPGDATISTALVPVVASVHGKSGIEWRTDVAVRNDSGDDVTILLLLQAAPGDRWMSTVLPAGQSMTFVDVVWQLFGLREVISPLLVHTFAARSVTVGATIYPVEEGRVRSPEFIPISYATPAAGIHILPGLQMNDQYRTNIGLVNLNDEAVRFTMALQRIEGRHLAVSSFVIGAGGLVQVSLENLFPLITEGSDFSLVVETSAANAYSYASVIDNSDHRATFVQPLLLQFAGR
ncbi:MAG TPA: hypothetical protein VMT00_08485 [Thermoanaerobaculia bacterium]|nr:hypothetical protein [Thermoanaerobaculia bacterium]